ncbi:MAG: TonB-dependent receptor [Bacteroidia bacterium]|nr:TonB-dependent receptor [Bacteroidia bacterium]
MRHVYSAFLLSLHLLLAQEERVVPTQPRTEPKATRPSAITITGQVTSEQGEPLSGAYIRVQGSVQGAVAGTDGSFKLILLSPSDSIRLEVSFVGYEPAIQTLSLQQATQPLKITLREVGTRAQEVVISATRVSETIMNSPVTVLKMSAREVIEAPGLNLMQNIPFVKGVEQVSTSLTFQVVNSRGFNSTNNTRFVQRMDGVEMQAPALNFPVGVITNAADLDIESVEITPGPASALYGPNAFNGIMNVYTKDPFRFPGLSAAVRVGINHIDGVDTTPQPLYEIAARYAYVWNNRLGIKFHGSWFDAHDWIAQDASDRGSYAGVQGVYAIPGPQNPGYDAVNRYGDEARIGPADISRLAAIGAAIEGTNRNLGDLNFYIARTGYWERDIIQYSARVSKATAGIYYRLSDKAQLSYTGFISTGSTVYQSVNRYSLRSFIYGANKVELSGPDYKVWVYGIIEDAGKSFDSRFAALNLLSSIKPHTNWMAQYVLSYTGQLYNALENIRSGLADSLGIPRGGDHAASRAFADSDRANAVIPYFQQIGIPPQITGLFTGGARPAPGTPEFRRALNTVIGQPNFAQGGARFVDRSSLYHAEGQYDLSKLIRFANVLVGGNFRYFLINSQGTIFSDTTGPIGLWEYGGFLQANRTFWKERIRLLGSLRYDKNRNFRGQLTPRIGVVAAIDKAKNHNIRASFQTGFRMPTLQAQYIDLNLGPFKFIGALRPSDEAYGIIRNNYSLESVQAFKDSLARRTRGSSNPADYANLLRTLPIENIKPEQNYTIEVGTRHLLANRIYVDIDYAYTWYNNFIGTIDLVGPRRYPTGDGRYITPSLTPDSIAQDRFNIYRRYYNSTTTVFTHNVAIALQYTINRNFFLNTNFNYADIILSQEAQKDRLIAGFNTPRYRANVYLTGRELLRNKRGGFSIGYRWVNAYLFQEPFHERIIPTYQLLDMQLSYKFPKLSSALRIGGQNILNNRHIEVPGGPTIGSMFYVQWIYDPFLP